jgi:redox-sensing transcriptional repressor
MGISHVKRITEDLLGGGMKIASEKTIERISLYRRLLQAAKDAGQMSVYSHDLAEMVGGTAAQVRRDLMEIGCAGNSKKGYDVDDLIDAISEFLDSDDVTPVALVGVGNLGRALLQFFESHHPKLKIMAVFDNDPEKSGRVIHGCRCYTMSEMPAVVADKKITVAVLAVPVGAAQNAAKQLEEAGVRGILNFAPEPLRVGPLVAVENMDMTMALEKVAYMARQNNSKENGAKR